MVIIGIDPHPASLTLAVLEETGSVLLTRTVENDDRVVERVLALAGGYPQRRWAIEGAGNSFVTPLVRALTARGETITDVSPGLTSQYRSKRGRKKTDEIDAGIIAQAALANPELPIYRRDETREQLKRYSRTRQRLATHLKAERMALSRLPPDSPLREPIEGLIASLQGAVETITAHIERLVNDLQPQLLSQKGVGPVVAGVVLAEAGDIRRFRNADAFAAYCGAAPIERSSGKLQQVRLNTDGNRRLNNALHITALVRLRLDPESRAYLARKLAEGKTPRAAIRQLKTLIARRLYRLLDATSPALPPEIERRA